ncbi:MAG: group 1 truncated hemoglobin [Chitinophagaceae bacterium]|jgi:hemoglobin|nr:group 1 truncated hemoglobin [Chitinophagaceae bacterium]
MKKSLFRLGGIALVLLVGFTACKKNDVPVNAGSALYQRLGGNMGIKKVVDDFIGIVVADNVINGFFATTARSQERVDRLKMNLVNQIGQAVGGTETYTGLSMKAAHVGMGIKDVHFNALVNDLVAALKKNGVSDADINTIGGALVPLKTDIVEP